MTPPSLHAMTTRSRLACLGVVVLLALTGCGDTDGAGQAEEAASTQTGVEVTYTPGDGEPVSSWPEVEMRCVKNRLHVYSRSDGHGEGLLLEPFFIFDVDLDEVSAGDTIELPLKGGAYNQAASVFVAEPGVSDEVWGNEASSTYRRASGTIVVNDLGCDDEPRIDVTFDDVRLISEYTDPPATFEGSLKLG